MALAAVGSEGQTTNGSLSVVETNAADPQVRLLQDSAAVLQLQLEELKLAFRKVVADNAELKLQAAEKEKTLQLLMQNLTVWKTEAELFQHKWEEAQLAAKASGVKLMTEGEQRLQKQLAESIRQLYDAQQQRDKLRDQMERLIEATGLVLQKGDGLDPQLKRLAETQRDSALEVVKALKTQVEPPGTNQVAAATGNDGDAGKVLDVNKALQLVVLNLGRVNGVTVGMPFIVLHGDAVVALVKVVDVREKISGALIEKTEKSANIEVGDRVKLSTVGK